MNSIEQDLVLKVRLPEHLFKELKKIIDTPNLLPNNPNLAGNIRREESLNPYRNVFNEYLSSLIQLYNPYTHLVIPEFLKLYTYETRDKIKLSLRSFWVNHMKQYEFNPIHSHDGCFSFVIFVKIPFKSEEMLKIAPGVEGNDNVAGCLQLIRNQNDLPMKTFSTYNIFADESWEGWMVMFPAYMHHLVYPFYGTEETRITVSGNIYCEMVKPPK